MKPLYPLKSSSLPFGLDISDLSLKLVSLDKSGLLNFPKKNKTINLLAYNQLPVPPEYFNEGKIIETEKIIALIKKLVAETKTPKKLSNYVVSVLPETKAFIKLIEVPNVAKEKIQDEINAEIKNHFPFAIDEIYLDWQKLPTPAQDPSKVKILVSVAPKEIVDNYTKLLLTSGLKPFVLEIESSAICRSLLPEELNSLNSQKNKSNIAIIDIGATRTSLIFYDQGTIQFTTNVPFSGQRITEKIAKKLKLNLIEAEKAKIKCGLSEKKCQGVLKKVLYDDLREMVAKIRNSFVFYQNHFPDSSSIEKIITCGGSANFEGLNDILEKELEIKTEPANPLVNIQNQKTPIPRDQILTYATAIGLALRGLQSTD